MARVDREEWHFVDSSVPARIFALVGLGGTGKSALLAHLFDEIGRGVWDWNANALRPDPRFIGYPVILEADPNVLDGISGALGKWTHRRVAVDRPIERFATTNKLAENEPAVWVGFDGIDEVPDEQLNQIARALANCVDSHPHARLIITSRPEQLGSVLPILNAKGLLRRLVIDEFGIDEAREAVQQATNRELRLKPRVTDILTAGQIGDSALIPQGIEPNEFEGSATQPLFIGVIQRMYDRDKRIDLIQAAYDEDPAALRELAQEYVYVLCERVRRRLIQKYVNERKIFNALKQLATDVIDPPRANRTDWRKVCEAQLNDLVTWGVLNAQCAASGLIRDLGSGAFEWRHPFVGRYLPAMKESKAWQ